MPQIGIGTWNLENLFRPGNDAGPTSQSAYDEKLDALAATIDKLAPDALAVQEVGDPEALDDLISRLTGTWRTALADPDSRGIRAGIISKRALTKVQQISAFPEHLSPVQVEDDGSAINQMGRPALHARIRAGGIAIDIVSAHLKSKLLSFPGGRFQPNDEGERARYAVYALTRRAAEAASVRAGADILLNGDGQTNAVIVAGDLNDEPEAATTQILLGPGGSEIGTTGFNQPDKGDATRLWNLEELIPQEQRYSRIYRGRRELIDHLLVSAALVGKASSVATGGEATPSITDNPSERRNAPGSDHRPVIATFDL